MLTNLIAERLNTCTYLGLGCLLRYFCSYYYYSFIIWFWMIWFALSFTDMVMFCLLEMCNGFSIDWMCRLLLLLKQWGCWLIFSCKIWSLYYSFELFTCCYYLSELRCIELRSWERDLFSGSMKESKLSHSNLKFPFYPVSYIVLFVGNYSSL